MKGGGGRGGGGRRERRGGRPTTGRGGRRGSVCVRGVLKKGVGWTDGFPSSPHHPHTLPHCPPWSGDHVSGCGVKTCLAMRLCWSQVVAEDACAGKLHAVYTTVGVLKPQAGPKVVLCRSTTHCSVGRRTCRLPSRPWQTV